MERANAVRDPVPGWVGGGGWEPSGSCVAAAPTLGCDLAARRPAGWVRAAAASCSLQVWHAAVSCLAERPLLRGDDSWHLESVAVFRTGK